MKSIQNRMQRFLDDLVASGRERGLQLVAYHQGQLVVDACAGIADTATGRPVTPETLFPVFSTGKGITATIAHRLVDRGVLAYDTPIASVWPEFAAQGKASMTLAHALSHATGLQHIPLAVKPTDLLDWKQMCQAMANAAPDFPAGSRMVYHAVTFSWTVGETLCRATGKTFPQLLHDEILEPLDLRDIYFGIPDHVENRVAVLDEIFPPDRPPLPDASKPNEVPAWMHPLHTWMNHPAARRACIPASNGIATARDLAAHYAALTPAGFNRRHLLSPQRRALATQLQTPTTPQDPPMYMSLGYFVDPPNPAAPRPITFGHGGYGGANALADPTNDLAVALTKNLFSPRGATADIITELRQALSLPA